MSFRRISGLVELAPRSNSRASSIFLVRGQKLRHLDFHGDAVVRPDQSRAELAFGGIGMTGAFVEVGEAQMRLGAILPRGAMDPGAEHIFRIDGLSSSEGGVSQDDVKLRFVGPSADGVLKHVDGGLEHGIAVVRCSCCSNTRATRTYTSPREA